MVFEKNEKSKISAQERTVTLMRSLLHTAGCRVVRAPETDAEQNFSHRNLSKLHHVRFCPKVHSNSIS